jgi:seryl-tRNA synthetase
MAQQEIRAAKEEMKETKAELREAKEEMKEVLAEMKKAERDRLAIAREVEREVSSRVVTVMTTALAVVAGLFWQTAINDTIKTFIPVSGAWQYEIAVAMGVTVGAAVTIYLISKSTERLNGK